MMPATDRFGFSFSIPLRQMASILISSQKPREVVSGLKRTPMSGPNKSVGLGVMANGINLLLSFYGNDAVMTLPRRLV